MNVQKRKVIAMISEFKSLRVRHDSYKRDTLAPSDTLWIGVVLRALKIDGIHSSSNQEEGMEENMIVVGFLQDRVNHISSKSNRV